ncbi:lambda-exonuclease family protein [Actinomadura sp. NPDC049382]|uniref:YqaJ viral recombinase family nuclease n=1 Tax=Actinomadura sp. NPDC049382 TaxID=3158220 RepID=UPI0034146FED
MDAVSARLVLPPDAPREEWLAARRLGITASEIAVILGISPFDSAFNLYYKKRGEISEDFDNIEMSLGRHLEPWIADRWAESQSGWLVAPGRLWQNTDRLWQLATTDRDLYRLEETTIGVPHSVLEIKSSGTYDGWGEDGTDEIPPYYRAQVLWQLDTLGLETAHVTCLFLSSRSIRNYVVAYDEADVKLMRDAAQDFLDMVEQGQVPAIDHTPATAQALKQLYPLDADADDAEVDEDLAYAYSQAALDLKDAQENYDLMVNQVRARMGQAKRAVCGGRKVATRSVYEQTRVDAKRLRTEFPDAYEACRTTSTVDKLTPARAKKEKP